MLDAAIVWLLRLSENEARQSRGAPACALRMLAGEEKEVPFMKTDCMAPITSWDAIQVHNHCGRSGPELRQDADLQEPRGVVTFHGDDCHAASIARPAGPEGDLLHGQIWAVSSSIGGASA